MGPLWFRRCTSPATDYAVLSICTFRPERIGRKTLRHTGSPSPDIPLISGIDELSAAACTAPEAALRPNLQKFSPFGHLR